MTPLEALARARAAWEASQPQLFIELYPTDELSETRRLLPELANPGEHGTRLAEPAQAGAPLLFPPKGGLNPGPEPRHGHALTGVRAVVAPPASFPSAGGSGPITNDRDGRDSGTEDRARPRR